MSVAKPQRSPIHLPGTGVAAADRTLKVLSAFQTGDGTVPLAELSRRTGLYKSTILRLAISLERAGYLSRNVNGDFFLGGEIARLADIHNETHDLRRVVLPALRFLAQETKETASFWTLTEGRRLCLMHVKSPLNLRMEVRAGTQRTLDGSSAAQALTMRIDAEGPREALPPTFYTSSIGTPHVASLSTPVFDAECKVAGSLTLSGPESRLDAKRAQELRTLIANVAADVTRKLGGSGSQRPS